MARKVLAAILGGIAFFAWSSIAHMVLPLGTTGVKEVANDDAVLAAMRANVPDHGFYLLPGTHLPPNATRQQQGDAMKQRMEKVAHGPEALLVYHPIGDANFGRMLLVEFATNVVQIFLAVLLLGYTSVTGFGARWRFVTIAGLLAGISTNLSYWNWYGFPGSYTLAYTFTIVVGFAVAGLVVAAMLKPAAALTKTASA